MASPMRITKVQFRILVCLQLLTMIAYGITYVYGQSSLPPELRRYTESGAGIDLPYFAVLGAFLTGTALAVISSIGLFFFWAPARWLCVLLIAQALTVTPFLGPLVQSGWAAALDGLSAVLSGVLVATSFLLPVSEYFERRSKSDQEVSTISAL